MDLPNLIKLFWNSLNKYGSLLFQINNSRVTYACIDRVCHVWLTLAEQMGLDSLDLRQSVDSD